MMPFPPRPPLVQQRASHQRIYTLSWTEWSNRSVELDLPAIVRAAGLMVGSNNDADSSNTAPRCPWMSDFRFTLAFDQRVALPPALEPLRSLLWLQNTHHNVSTLSPAYYAIDAATGDEYSLYDYVDPGPAPTEFASFPEEEEQDPTLRLASVFIAPSSTRAPGTKARVVKGIGRFEGSAWLLARNTRKEGATAPDVQILMIGTKLPPDRATPCRFCAFACPCTVGEWILKEALQQQPQEGEVEQPRVSSSTTRLLHAFIEPKGEDMHSVRTSLRYSSDHPAGTLRLRRHAFQLNEDEDEGLAVVVPSEPPRRVSAAVPLTTSLLAEHDALGLDTLALGMFVLLAPNDPSLRVQPLCPEARSVAPAAGMRIDDRRLMRMRAADLAKFHLLLRVELNQSLLTQLLPNPPPIALHLPDDFMQRLFDPARRVEARLMMRQRTTLPYPSCLTVQQRSMALAALERNRVALLSQVANKQRNIPHPMLLTDAQLARCDLAMLLPPTTATTTTKPRKKRGNANNNKRAPPSSPKEEEEDPAYAALVAAADGQPAKVGAVAWKLLLRAHPNFLDPLIEVGRELPDDDRDPIDAACLLCFETLDPDAPHLLPWTSTCTRGLLCHGCIESLRSGHAATRCICGGSHTFDPSRWVPCAEWIARRWVARRAAAAAAH